MLSATFFINGSILPEKALQYLATTISIVKMGNIGGTRAGTAAA